MKETGLMFKAPLVRAILSGQKTQTRRVMKLNFNDSFSYMQTNLPTAYNEIIEFREQEGTWFGLHGWNELCKCTCPFGKPGDRIYVRETHAHHPEFAQMAFRADGEEFEDADGWLWVPKWTPAIHMKKEEARIWLEITGVRVERLQSISRADAIAEGIQFFNGDHECGAKNYMDKTNMDYSLCPIDSFETLWKSTGGDWEANPWVWVIDFKTISTTGRPA
jgi:hypothetical protein